MNLQELNLSHLVHLPAVLADAWKYIGISTRVLSFLVTSLRRTRRTTSFFCLCGCPQASSTFVSRLAAASVESIQNDDMTWSTYISFTLGCCLSNQIKTMTSFTSLVVGDFLINSQEPLSRCLGKTSIAPVGQKHRIKRRAYRFWIVFDVFSFPGFCYKLTSTRGRN